MSSTEIEQVIERARKREPEAVAQLYELYSGRIYRYAAYRVATTVEAEDLTAEVFVKMIESLPNYRSIGIPFEAWLFRIAAARTADYHRRNARRPQIALSESLADAEAQPEEYVQAQEEFETLRRAIGQLSQEQQNVLVLRFIERKSHEDVAQILSKSVAAVKSIQHRALVQLTGLLGSAEKVRHYLRGSHE